MGICVESINDGPLTWHRWENDGVDEAGNRKYKKSLDEKARMGIQRLLNMHHPGMTAISDGSINGPTRKAFNEAIEMFPWIIRRKRFLALYGSILAEEPEFHPDGHFPDDKEFDA